jgi:hypothetical protein
LGEQTSKEFYTKMTQEQMYGYRETLASRLRTMSETFFWLPFIALDVSIFISTASLRRFALSVSSSREASAVIDYMNKKINSLKTGK